MFDEAENNSSDEFIAEEATAENVSNDSENIETTEKSGPNGYEKRIATLVHRERQKDQELAQLRAENQTLKAVTPASKEAEVPDYPSDDLRYDNPEQYKRKLDDYNRYVAREEFNRLESERRKAQESEQESERLNAEKARQGEIVKKYIEGGISSGISEDKMAANERMLQSAQIDAGLAEQIYADDHGAKIVDFLADNPDKLSELASMNPYQAAVKIATDIKPQALSSRPAPTNAPDPIESTSGGGLPPGDDRPMIRGAKFE